MERDQLKSEVTHQTEEKKGKENRQPFDCLKNS